MYWLFGISILTVISATLSVATNVALPNNIMFKNIVDVLPAPLILITVTALLILINQNRISISTNSQKNNSSNNYHLFNSIIYTRYYLIIVLLFAMLIGGSALQALSNHQHAESTAISDSMRVQALVSIKGVSDSVYNFAGNSGYRQVATIKYLSPLTTEMTAETLRSTKAPIYIENSIENSDLKNLEYRVLLSAYPNKSSEDSALTHLNKLKPGDQVLMTLTIAPLNNSQVTINNPTGFDSYRWLRSRHIDGVANVIAVGTPLGNGANSSISSSELNLQESISYFDRFRTRIDQWRWQLRQHFYKDWSAQTTAQQQASAVTLSLLTGDRSLINRDTKDLYQIAGISHLLAISGTHVLFLAIILAAVAVSLFNRICPYVYQLIPRWQVRWLVMINAAFVYALFTGFDVPAARTAWMLLAIGVVRLTLLPISTMRVLLALAVIMAWVDPYVLWQAGYWLSFIAVALLLKYDDKLQTQVQSTLGNTTAHVNKPQNSKKNIVRTKVWLLFKRVFRLQCWLFIALLPITLLLFGKASLWGLFINLFAIGLFGWVVVPLNLLAGLFYLIVPAVADILWSAVSTLIGSLHELIRWLTELPVSSAWLYTPVNMAMILMAGLILLPWLLPRGLISRGLAVPPLVLLTMTLYANQQKLTLIPTLYILPTGDRYLSAAILQYPISEKESDRDNQKKSAIDSVSWLFLADHRPSTTKTMISSLTADKLSAQLEQQLRTLSIKHLEGVIVQTSVIALTDKVSVEQDNTKMISELLSETVVQLTQRLPTNYYWQAGRYERWESRQQSKFMSSNLNQPLISAQSCTEGKTWQSVNNDLSLQVLTGWNEIDDAAVWDCTVAVDSRRPIRVLQYNASDPMRSLPLAEQKAKEVSNSFIKTKTNEQSEKMRSRIILDAATHQRVWKLWSLLCVAKPFTIDLDSHGIGKTKGVPTTWLAHSDSQVSADVLNAQKVNAVMTYDSKILNAALKLADDP